MPAIVLKEEVRDGKPWCLLAAGVEDEQLSITRIDFEEWERNRRDGQVEITFAFDEENTLRFRKELDATDSTDLLKKIKSRFRKHSAIFIMGDIKKFCDTHGIGYRYQVWY